MKELNIFRVIGRIFLCLITFLAVTQAQSLEVSLDIAPSTCAANGAISINVAGGSGDYRYSLNNDCDVNQAPSLEPFFNNLKPCIYEITILDRVTQEQVTITDEVEGQYEEMQLSIARNGCDAELLVEGGAPPFLYFYSVTGRDGFYQENANPIFSSIPGSTIWMRVEDACGLSAFISSTTVDAPITGFTYWQYEDGIRITPKGGIGNFVFEMNSNRGTYVDSTGFFSWDIVGCDPRISITDGCSNYTGIADNLEPRGSIGCVNYNEGYVLLEPTRGIPPFSYRVETSMGVFESSTGEFDNLPINDWLYDLYIIDSCGTESLIAYSTRYKPLFKPVELESVASSTVITFEIDRQCSGPFQYPIDIICDSCPNNESVSVNNRSENNITFTGGSIGEWQFTFTDDCGDEVSCKDSLVLELTPACDSIIVKIVDLFNCSNGTFARRELILNQVEFFLRDMTGNVLDANTNGSFQGLPKGEYEVIAILSSQDTLQATTALDVPVDIDPVFMTEIENRRTENGTCETVYYLDMEQELGPFIISNQDNSYYQIFNDFNEDNCIYYQVGPLVPGIYTITSMSKCGSITIELPQPSLQLTAEILKICPDDGQVEVSGLMSLSEWENWYAPFGLNVNWEDFSEGAYIVDNSLSSPDGSIDYTFTELSAGAHSFFMSPFNSSNCIADVVELEWDTYQNVELDIAGEIVCDGENTTDLTINIDGGAAPFTLELLNCDNPGSTLDTYSVDSINAILENFPLGEHCFKIKDQCNIDADFQVSVAPFSDSIRYEYTCENKVELNVDNLPFEYEWKDEGGNIIGTSFNTNIPAPEIPTDISLTVDLEKCQLARTTTIHPREVIPSINILSPSQYLCETDTLLLEAQISTSVISINWNTGSNERLITISEGGSYAVEVQNDLGCRNSASIAIEEVTPPSNIIDGLSSLCEDSTITLSLAAPFSSGFWSSQEVADSISISTPGNYTVSVIDSLGCRWMDSLNVEQLINPTPRIVGDTLLCPNTTTELQTEVSFPNYSWSNGATTNTIIIGDGDHEVKVTDSNGCSGIAKIRIQELPQVSVSMTKDTTICLGDSTIILVSVSGTGLPVSLSLTDESLISLWQFGDVQDQDLLRLFVNSNTNIQLESASLEGYDCPIELSSNISIRVNEVTGEITELQPISCNGASDGRIAALMSSSFSPLSFYWNNGSRETILNDLQVGEYSVTVTDQIGCVKIDSILLIEPAPIQAQLNINPPLCFGVNDGKISIGNIIGGTGPYSWLINDRFFDDLNIESTSLSPGEYFIQVFDTNGCYQDTIINFEAPKELTLSLGKDRTVTLGDTIHIHPITNFIDFEDWTWSPLRDTIRVSPELVATPTENHIYKLVLQNSNDCIVEDEITVFVNKNDLIYTPTAFSPNGDGVNDFFTLYPHPGSVEKVDHFSVYDRWGNQVYYQDNFLQVGNGWDGSFNGKVLSSGVYVWQAKVTYIDKTSQLIYGDVTLVK